MTEYSVRISGFPKILVLDIRKVKLCKNNLKTNSSIMLLGWHDIWTNMKYSSMVPGWKIIRILYDSSRTTNYSILNSGLCNFPLNLKMNGFEIILQLDFLLRPP